MKRCFYGLPLRYLRPVWALAALACLALVPRAAHAEAIPCASGSVASTNGPCSSAVVEFVDLSGNAQQVDASHPLPVTATLPAGTNNIGKVVPLGADGSTNSAAHPIYTQPNTGGFTASASITRTNDTNVYAANDVIGAATGATAAVAFSAIGPSAGGEMMLTSASIEVDASAIISGETSYRICLYNVTPPSAIGDNGAFDIGSGDRASFLGCVPLGTPVDEGSTLYLESNGINKQFTVPSGGAVYGYLTTAGTYTPTASRVYKVVLHAVAM